jgi:outer membrane cobalamin receptor
MAIDSRIFACCLLAFLTARPDPPPSDTSASTQPGDSLPIHDSNAPFNLNTVPGSMHPLPDSLQPAVTNPSAASQNAPDTAVASAAEETTSPPPYDPSLLPDPNTPVYEITITAKRATPDKDPTAKPTVVSGDRVRETSRSTPFEALSQESADIYVTSRGAGLHGISNGSSGGMYIRGLGGSPNSQILVVEDGAPDYQGIFGHPLPDAFFPSLIDRVTVVKGGDCVLYGTNAMGGAIVIENRWPEHEGLKLENDAAYGSFNTFRDRLTLLHKHGRFETASAFSAFSTDGHRDGANGNSKAGRVGLRFPLPGGFSASFHEKAVFLDGGDPGTVLHPQTDHRFMVLRSNASGRIEKSAGTLSLTIVPWFNAGEHRLYDGFFSRDYLAGGYAEGSGELVPGTAKLLVGMAAEHIDGEVLNRIEGTEENVESVSSGAPYGQIELTPGGHITAVGGGRLLWSNRYGWVPLYKAGATWDRYPALTLHTHVTRNFRQPTLRELYLPFPVANPDLRPEHAFNIETGVGSAFAGCTASLTVFRTQAEDLIKYFGMWPSAEVVNIDRIEITGIEGEFKTPRLGPWGMELNACWQDVGRFTRQNPDAKMNGRLDYKAKTRVGLLEWAIIGEWVHGLYINNYHRDPMKDVFFLDGSVRLRTERADGITLEPYCIVRNLLDAPYEDIRYSFIRNILDASNEYIRYYPMPGINVLAGLNIKL